MLKNKRRQVLLVGGSVIASTLLSNKLATAQSSNPTMNSTTDRDAIINAVNQIAIMADLRNWDACRDAFSDRVATDYTSLTGGEPSIVNAEDLVSGWETFFSQTFKVTQHLIGSHVVTITGDTATCLSNFQAHHVYLDSAKGTWTLGGIYEHGLIQTPQGWKVNRMKMTWTWESGDRPN
ncbi:nuclear transport factor 2 family protein [Oscillatoria sp. FACHB-1407]|uniref:nuclear transport factor 2 family protein n=1 Tax=Oscillatoria sp. FACHB-1407 TaxID=2692847 RepID=UPI001688FB57|nr:nuclear transport factor 2 family protein [Oscillatoria sp. FACHB-1407]MBD2463480.1 nuclear transport factor 2 family protein [Oscillatoria sp. FACHB-1407]